MGTVSLRSCHTTRTADMMIVTSHQVLTSLPSHATISQTSTSGRISPCPPAKQLQHQAGYHHALQPSNFNIRQDITMPSSQATSTSGRISPCPPAKQLQHQAGYHHALQPSNFNIRQDITMPSSQVTSFIPKTDSSSGSYMYKVALYNIVLARSIGKNPEAW